MEKKRNLTLNEILNLSTNYLLKHKIQTPRLDAELLIAKALNIERLKLYLNFDMILNESEIRIIRDFLKRRVQGEPVAYITEVKEFYSIEFIVNKNVLIPRPDTEAIVDTLLWDLKKIKRNTPRVVDIGTGCGAIIISSAMNFENAIYFASDISMPAIMVCYENCKRHNLLDKINLINCDLLAPFRERTIDIIVSNPPYIPSFKIKNLQKEIKDYEPRIAIDGGDDGLRMIKRIISDASRTLKSNGSLIIEVSAESQADEVIKILNSEGFGDIDYVRDISYTIKGVKARLKTES